MLKKIIGTTGSNILIAILNFVILYLNTNILKEEGVGTIALIILGITIVMLVNNFFSGSALVYLLPRTSIYKLLIVSYTWVVLVCAIFYFIQFVFQLDPSYSIHVVFLSLIQGFFTFNFKVIQSKEKIKELNIINLLQIVFTLISVVFFFYIIKQQTIISYVKSLYIGYLLSFMISLVIIKKYLRKESLTGVLEIIKKTFVLGSFVQVATALQLANYRISYYIIKSVSISNSLIGIYSVANQIVESVWTFGRSISLVQYARISNTTEMSYAKNITIQFIKFLAAITIIILLVILFIPDIFYSYVFSEGFVGLSSIIACLSIGVFANQISMIFSHYFAGIGKHHHNLIASAIGFVITISFAIVLIPIYKLYGAAITASLSYSSACLYQLIVFMKISDTSLKEFFFTKKDIENFKKECSKMLGV